MLRLIKFHIEFRTKKPFSKGCKLHGSNKLFVTAQKTSSGIYVRQELHNDELIRTFNKKELQKTKLNVIGIEEVLKKKRL